MRLWSDHPLSMQLCQSLDTLKRDVRFEESSQQKISQLGEEKKDQQLNASIVFLREEIQAKNRQLQDKEEMIRAKNEIISARDSSLLSVQCEVKTSKGQLREKEAVLTEKDKQIQALKNELEAKEDQLRRLRQQLESVKATSITHQEEMTQAEEITEAKGSQPSHENPERGLCPSHSDADIEDYYYGKSKFEYKALDEYDDGGGKYQFSYLIFLLLTFM